MTRRRSPALGVQIGLLALSSCLALAIAIYVPRAIPGPPLGATSIAGVAPLITVMCLGPLMLSAPERLRRRWLLTAGFTVAPLLLLVLIASMRPAVPVIEILLPDLLR